MITLYGNLESGNVYKVRLLMSHLGIEHRRIEVNQVAGDPRSPEFLAINPVGKVPAIRLDDGRVLSESGAILHYLARGTRYWPDQAWDQAEVLRWMFFEQYSHEPCIAVNRYLRRFATSAATGLESEVSRARIAENAEKGDRALGVMEQQLSSSDWFAADRYTIADMALYAYTHVAHEGDFDLGRYAAIRRWLDRVSRQPGYVAMSEETSAEEITRLVPDAQGV